MFSASDSLINPFSDKQYSHTWVPATTWDLDIVSSFTFTNVLNQTTKILQKQNKISGQFIWFCLRLIYIIVVFKQKLQSSQPVCKWTLGNLVIFRVGNLHHLAKNPAGTDAVTYFLCPPSNFDDLTLAAWLTGNKYALNNTICHQKMSVSYRIIY